MKSPVVYGNPIMFGPVDWNYAAGAPVKRGKSVDDLGDAGWARERERIAHLQHIQQLHQLQQQQVGYPAYGVAPHGQPHGHVMVPSPCDPVPAPGSPMPVHGGMMVPMGVPGPPPGHVPAPWPAQWENQAQIRQGNVCQQPNRGYGDPHAAAFQEKRTQGRDVYFHPGSEDGHLNVRISEWKGGNCFYQGPEDYSPQDYSRVPQEKANDDLRTQGGFGALDEDRRRRGNERYEPRSHRDLEEYDREDKYSPRGHYDGKYNERCDDRDQRYYDSRRRREHDPRQRDSEYEDSYDRKDSYARKDNYRDRDHYDRDYYDSKESDHYRHYQRREEDRYYDEQKRKDRYFDRQEEDRYDRRESNYRDEDDYNRRGGETYTSQGRGPYDSEVDDHRGYRERCRNPGDDMRDEHRRRDHYRAREHYEGRTVDDYERENEDRYVARDRYRDLRSTSVDSPYEDYPKKDSKTHIEQWVEQQNQKLALRQMHSFEDPVTYQHSDDQERGYESSGGSVGSKRGRKPVYVGSLDRSSFYRKTAPSALRKSQFATIRKQNKGKHRDRKYSRCCICTT